MSYTRAQIEQFEEYLDHWMGRESNLMTNLFNRTYENYRTEPFICHGFKRRLDTLKHTLTRTFEVLPPSEENPSGEALMDATVHLQAFVINVFGAIDNLARIWVMEKGVAQPNGRSLPPKKIGLMPGHSIVRNSLSGPFQDYLASVEAWFGYLENYRHALAHRVPLYIPPRQLDDEAAAEYRRLGAEIANALGNPERYGQLRGQQDGLGLFNPVMMHSYEEQALPVFLHSQMICDFSTVVVIGEHMLRELDGLPPA